MVLPQEEMNRLTNNEAQRLSREFVKTMTERRDGNGRDGGNGNGHDPHTGNDRNGSNGNKDGNETDLEYDGGEPTEEQE